MAALSRVTLASAGLSCCRRCRRRLRRRRFVIVITIVVVDVNVVVNVVVGGRKEALGRRGSGPPVAQFTRLNVLGKSVATTRR